MGRKSTTMIELGPYRFPAGNLDVFFSQSVESARSGIPDPLRFRPPFFQRRFTPEAKAATRPRSGTFLWRRRAPCIERILAGMEGVLILDTIAQKWGAAVCPISQPMCRRKSTLRPKYPIHSAWEELSKCRATPLGRIRQIVRLRCLD